MNAFRFYRVRDWVKNTGTLFIGFMCGMHVEASATHVPYPLLLVLAYLVFAYMLSFSVNDFFDGRHGNERNYASEYLGRTSKPVAAMLYGIPLTLMALLLCLTWFVTHSIPLILVMVFPVILTLAYSIPPFRAKKHFLFSLPLNAACIGVFQLLAGYLTVTDSINYLIVMLSLVYGNYILLHETIHQISHLKDDVNAGVRSLPSVLGVRETIRMLVLSQLLFSLILLANIMLFHSILPLIPLAFTAFRLKEVASSSEKTDFTRLRNRLYGIPEGLSYIMFFYLA
ncbi:MAG: UbiA family prenyltransferase [Candidatus Altiarchaeota archaeon]